MFPEQRPRRLRRTGALRRLVAETRLDVDDLVAPLFVKEGIDDPEPVVSMPGVVQHTQESLRKEVRALADLGVPGVILFGVPAAKDAVGSGADAADGVVQVAIRNLKDEVGDDLVVMADACLDEYTDHGHCGLLTPAGDVDNDGRLSLVSHFLETPWEFEVVDVDDLDAFERALERADAMVSMNWRWDVPATAMLKLLQLPGAGTDDIDFSRLPSSITVCNCFEHEIGIAEYVLGTMLEWVIGIRGLDAQFRQGVVEEVKALLARGVPETALPFSGLVYRQVLELLHGVRGEADTRALIVRENRHYSKRQLIWFRKEPNLRWILAAGDAPETQDRVARALAEPAFEL